MRIDVITLQAVQNYGSLLQAFATQELLKAKGCEVKFINYIREDVRYKNVLQEWCGSNIIKKIAMYPTVLRWNKIFKNFQREHLHITRPSYTTEEDFKKYPLEADAYCTGSDQVWNSGWNRGILPMLYLNFVPETCYKFAFAASFGRKELSEEEVKAVTPYFKQYNKISVRESSAKEIFEKQFNMHKVEHIVDPTLCVSGEFWRKHATLRKIKEDYILVYNLNRSRDFDNYAKKLAKITGLKLVRFCTRYDQFYRPGKSVLVPEVFEFISLIDNARYVLTDSFHATAFSLNMNTEPICIYPKEFGGRLESILKQTHSLHRHVESYDDVDVINRPVDFKIVNEVLAHERKKASDYLDSVIDEMKSRKEIG